MGKKYRAVYKKNANPNPLGFFARIPCTMHTHVKKYVRTVRMHVRMCVRMHVHTHAYACVRTPCIRTCVLCIRTCIRTCVSCIRTCIRTIRTCIRTCIRTRNSCVCTCIRTCIRMRTHAYAHGDFPMSPSREY